MIPGSVGHNERVGRMDVLVGLAEVKRERGKKKEEMEEKNGRRCAMLHEQETVATLHYHQQRQMHTVC